MSDASISMNKAQVQAMITNPTGVRVLIAEDSPVARELLVAVLQNVPGFQIVGTARTGVEAVQLAKRLRPDLITMDIHMPEMDGFEAARQIMREAPCPIVVISNSTNMGEQELTFNALQVGALSVLNKPTMYDPPEVLEALTAHVKLMAEVKVVRHWDQDAKCARKTQVLTDLPAGHRTRKTKIQVVALAASTGGPGILAEILGQLPADFGAPVLIVQHITPGFGQGLATWLNQQTDLQVRLAQDGDKPQAGQVLIAPDDYHLVVNKLGLVALDEAPAQHGLRPAADYLFNSVAQVYGAAAIGVILSGMGSDGAEGLRAMHQAGGHTIAQDEATCVVFGMPAVAIKLGAATETLPPDRIAAVIRELV